MAAFANAVIPGSAFVTAAREVNHEAEVGYDLEDLTPARVGRSSLSEAGDSPQVRFRLPAATRAEAAALAAREGKTLSQLARDAIEAYLTARRSA